MKRCTSHAALVLAYALIAANTSRVEGADAAVQAAVAALQRQDYKDAEQRLRTELKLHPDDTETLSLLGVALDEQQRFQEARVFHERAIAGAPHSRGALYNYANNLLATGDEKNAREVLLKSIAIDPADLNANLALAQLAISRRDGGEALACLDRVKDAPNTEILRLTALDLAGRNAEASALFEQISKATQDNGKVSATYGQMLAKAGQFDQAEIFYSRALTTDPANFPLLYNLGVTASQAGHNERARTALEAAVRQQPQNVDALYTLALIDNSLAQSEAAIRLLADAARLAPQRADVQKLTAIVARNLKADEDSVAAWQRYLKLTPNDDEARRELAFEKARLALLDEALPELKAYVARHPDDAVGYYELGMAESVDDPAQAIATLDHAISLKSDLLVARAGRGILLYADNKPEAAVPDLEFAVSRIPVDAPDRAPILDHLGQALAALDRVTDAIPVLRQATELAPDDSTIQLHLANALAEAGQTEESDALMGHFRQMSPGARAQKVTGVVDYLSMTPQDRHDLYRARLEKAMNQHPDDPKAQILYLKLLLTDNQVPDAVAAAKKLALLKPGSAALADAGHALLAARQFSPAKDLLEQAASGDSSAAVRLDLAIATFRVTGSSAIAADEGLQQLDKIPAVGRGSDFYLAQAQMLAVAGKNDAALSAVQKALPSAPRDPDFYWQAVALMMKLHRQEDALSALDLASKALPQEAQIPALRAAVLELAGKTDEARHLLRDAQHRWPEASFIWAGQGIILAAHQEFEEARTALETAVALGAHSAETFYALAQSSLRTGPSHLNAAERAINQALKIAPDDSQAQALAREITVLNGSTIGQQKPGTVPPDEIVNPGKLFLSTPPPNW